MKPTPLLLASLTLLGVPGRAVAQESHPRRPWTPPHTGLPKAFVDEVAFLLAHGLGDPRGGIYREATIASETGASKTRLKVRGWVMGSHIVLGDGLTYDVIEAGSPADLDADVRAMTVGTGSGSTPDPRWISTFAAELLLAGRPDLVEKVSPRKDAEPGETGLIEVFVANTFHRAIAAHKAGDDTMTLRVGRDLLRERPALEREALAHNGQRNAAGSDGNPYKTDEQFPFLTQLSSLVADAERRLAHGSTRRPFDPKTATVSELIDHLDDAKAQQWFFPGPLVFRHDPIVTALVTRGDPAVGPLLDTMERDERLTRSVAVDSQGEFRHMIMVREVAYSVFTAIAGTDEFDEGGNGRIDIAKLRAYWKENARRSAPERWFATLADDNAAPRRWMDAATRLFDGQDVRRDGGVISLPKDEGALKAEPLRGRTGPSLSDLLAKRSRELSEAERTNGGGTFAKADALRLALLLERWDPKASLPVLQEVSRATMTHAVTPNDLSVSLEGIAEVLDAAWEARSRLGDREVWSEVAAWWPKAQESVRTGESALVFRPLARHPDEPAFRGVAARLFLDPRSPQSPHAVAKAQPGGWAEAMAFTPLLGIPEFRASLLETLDDKTPFGELWVDENGVVFVKIDNSTQSYNPDPAFKNDPRRERLGGHRPNRVGDSMAFALSELKGAPEFKLYWSEAERDAAIGRMKAFLTSRQVDFGQLVPWPNG